MSRSKPTDNSPNPATRWFEWDGATGNVRYYDKEAKENVVEGDKFTFILLDQLSTVKGWNDASDSGIYANEVKDTRSEPLIVKAFKGGVLAEGFYKNIRDKVIAQGGHFVSNCYIAWRDVDGLRLGSVQFKGSALRSWMEFTKENRADLYKKAVKIDGSVEGKKGKVVFKTPVFSLVPISAEADQQALELDHVLQGYLESYFSRTRTEQSEPHNDLPEEPPPTHHEPEPEEPF